MVAKPKAGRGRRFIAGVIHCAAASSFLVGLGCCAMWWRSQRYGDFITWVYNERGGSQSWIYAWEFESGDGEVKFGWDRYPGWFEKTGLAYYGAQPYSVGVGTGKSFFNRRGYGLRGHEVWVPWTAPIVVLGLWPIGWADFWVRKRRRLRRAREGLCIHCGYDLRYSPDRCPECGARAEK